MSVYTCGLPLHNRHHHNASLYICVWIYTCLLIHLLIKNENLNNTKSCVVSRDCVAQRADFSPIRVPSSSEFPSYTLPSEHPVQQNTAPIYMCVYTRPLSILSLRIFDLINNKKMFRYSPVHSPGEQPVQLNTAPIYICVYTRSLPILSLRIIDLINNKKLFSVPPVHFPPLNK